MLEHVPEPESILKDCRALLNPGGKLFLSTINRNARSFLTAIVGADGQVQGVLEPFTRAALRGDVQAYTGATPYVRWGNWPVIMLSLLLSAFFWRRKALS